MIRQLACGLTVLAFTPMFAVGQDAVAPTDRYGEWETLGRTVTLSLDGAWVVYDVRRVNEENELRLTATAGGQTYVFPFGSSPEFSDDGAWFGYSIGVSPTERERLVEKKDPVRNSLGLRSLGTTDSLLIDDVESFSFSGDSRYIAYRRYAAEDRVSADLIVRDLSTGTTTSFGLVDAFAWSDAGSHLAMTILAEDGTGALHLYDPASESLRILGSGETAYRQLVWREDADDLAALRAQPDSMFADTSHVIQLWRGLSSGTRADFELDPSGDRILPEGMRISEHRAPSWSEDGRAIYFGMREREPITPQPDSTEDAEKVSDVQIWHATDQRIIPMQRAQEQRDLRRTLPAVWHVDSGNVVQLGIGLMERADVMSGDRFAYETDGSRYQSDEMFGRNFDDVYVVDVMDGARRLAIENVRHVYTNGSTGRFILYFAGEDYWVYDVESGERRNLTGASDAIFINLDYDYPVRQYPPHGVAGWTRDDEAVWLYDEYDIWRVALGDGQATRLTDGRSGAVIHRRVRLDLDEDFIDEGEWQYVRITGDFTKKSGYTRLRGSAVEELVFEDASIQRLARAREHETFVFSRERFDDSPDIFVGGEDLSNARQLSLTNPFQDEFAWGRGTLVDYTSQTGRSLQGALFYPANHVPGQKYPMIVYQYEILSHHVHRYVGLSERNYYNASVWTQRGYFVLKPDIVYRGRDPGRSAVEAIVPAVQAVVDAGLVDADRIGLIGHSWGGYQATYVPTQTNIFAASVAGAPLTNFLSMMGAIHWTPGLPETGHWETGQARMEVPYWEDFDAHVRNSPAAFIHQLETPMLMTFGDDDGVVDWRQGVEFYNYARRIGREDFVMLVYPGEGHGLREKENQIDYHRRILQWFGHYLKGEPAASWITNGVSYLDRKKEIATGGGHR